MYLPFYKFVWLSGLQVLKKQNNMYGRISDNIRLYIYAYLQQFIDMLVIQVQYSKDNIDSIPLIVQLYKKIVSVYIVIVCLHNFLHFQQFYRFVFGLLMSVKIIYLYNQENKNPQIPQQINKQINKNLININVIYFSIQLPRYLSTNLPNYCLPILSKSTFYIFFYIANFLVFRFYLHYALTFSAPKKFTFVYVLHFYA
eukprot:TRINITY_DN4231_c0_g1_i3.p3 TRINITY_DN4231_c0_g1~~TRINITY_DN4231_c0_g1_i3.p3  ORF type:complete len:199 (-),score=-10.54 TRINITY_DN4231_c0_g1_i3:591-1187(-)